MAELPNPLVLDNSYPDSDSRLTNLTGIMRYVSDADANSLLAHAREIGDLARRDILLTDFCNRLLQVIAENPLYNRGAATGLIRADGTVPFTEKISGVAPTDSDHLTTKDYVDSTDSALSLAISALSASIGSLSSQQGTLWSSGWVTHTWNGGVKAELTFDFSSETELDLDKIASVSLVEKLNVAIATLANPSPSPEYIYRQIVIGPGAPGFQVGDWWIDGDRVLHVLIPQTTEYPTGYPSSIGYEDLQTISSRQIKAVLLTHA